MGDMGADYREVADELRSQLTAAQERIGELEREKRRIVSAGGDLEARLVGRSAHDHYCPVKSDPPGKCDCGIDAERAAYRKAVGGES